MTIRQSASTAAVIVLGAAALLLFTLLTLRHVGESYFLADQVDQLQKYEAALRLEPEGLWGGNMSGTTARALGPFGALVFGLPVSLGLGIDAIHALTSLFLAIATGIAFWQLARLSQVMAWGWLIVFTAMRMVWWNAAMFWVCTLLLPLGLLVVALFAANLRHPTTAKVAGIALVLLLALQVHLAALVGLPILVIAAGIVLGNRRPHGQPAPVPRSRVEGGRSVRDRNSRASLVMVLSLIGLALLPYLLAEAKTSFRNTRAAFSHVESAAQAGGGEGAHAAMETLVLAADPLVLLPAHRMTSLAVSGAIALAALVLLALRSRRVSQPAMAWLVVTTVIAVGGQALFFLLMARPLNGLHYAILLAPWYAIPSAALLAMATERAPHPGTRVAAPAFGVVAVLLLLFIAPGRADRFAEPTPWNYRTIITALDALCAGQAVETVEGPGLVDELTPSYDSVLRYTMKRGFSRCRYDPQSSIVIAANRDNAFTESIEMEGRQFMRELVLPPGLARYRRVAD